LHKNRSNRIISATILEENPFEDTDFPVVVITWGPRCTNDYEIYKNDVFIGMANYLKTKIPSSFNFPKNTIKFNVISGNLGIICIDKGDTIGGIKFTMPAEIKGPIKHSSRTSTIVVVDTTIRIEELIAECNKILAKYRSDTADVFLAPFKGNDRLGARRRRLDFTTARVIIEHALVNLNHSYISKNSTFSLLYD
jgi:hypothetical protein